MGDPFVNLCHAEDLSSPDTRRFLEIDRELGRLLQSGPPVDWEGSRRWCSDLLRGVIAASPETQRLKALLRGHRFIVGGDEHHVIEVASEPGRVFKITHGDNFGCRSYFSPHDPELSGKHFHGTGNADPFFYLRRWRILNNVANYQTRFEGFLLPERPNWLPRICISQPKLGGENPSVKAIRELMAMYGFAEISQDAFLHRRSRVLLTDVAPRNVRIINRQPVLFDAIATFASPEILAWAART
jgi:hypothetical protein